MYSAISFGQQDGATSLQVACHEGHTFVVDTLLRNTDATMVQNKFYNTLSIGQNVVLHTSNKTGSTHVVHICTCS